MSTNGAGAEPAEPVSPADLAALISRAEELDRKGDLAAAREAYLAVLRRGPVGPTLQRVEARLGAINVGLVMSPAPMPLKVEYVVKAGDFVQRIAKTFGTTVELIQAGNKIANPHLIKKGDRLQVLKGTFRIVVRKKENDLLLTLDNAFFKRYRIGTGKFGKTPPGTFTVTERIKEPVWWRPDGREVKYGDPQNILGTRWLTLRATGQTPDVRGYGIHGTWDDSTLGKSESAGCIRMRNADVEELFVLVPLGTAVEIRD